MPGYIRPGSSRLNYTIWFPIPVGFFDPEHNAIRGAILIRDPGPSLEGKLICRLQHRGVQVPGRGDVGLWTLIDGADQFGANETRPKSIVRGQNANGAEHLLDRVG